MTNKAEIIFSEKCLEYKKSDHPESPKRVKKAYKVLKKENYSFQCPEKISEGILNKVHSQDLIRSIKQNKFSDADSPNYPGIFEKALSAVGGAVKAQNLSEKNKIAFSLMRPPGHHAGVNFMGGFCYFNNIAIAVKNSGKRTLLVDIDGHHGNGTQNIFQGSKKVTYISLHRSPWYPGTGRESKENCLNFLLKANYGEKEYLKILEKALKKINPKEYEQLAISAGFDTYQGDLASLGLKNRSYKKIGEILGEIKLPSFAVLEGGYSSQVGQQIDKLIEGLQ